ncbi:MAG: hypothetical protein GKR96_11290 [Gammaproteobacteria bacterium]|nr:hypothetical protein [Gammaproteobacteria bacterium]
MQKARIRTGWKKKNRSISIEEFANAMSAITWRISLNAAKNLHDKDFVYDNDQQRLGVIREYLYFLIHCADRLMFSQLDQTQRTVFLTALCEDCFRHYRENSTQIIGQSINKAVFIEDLNHTMNTLSECRFTEDTPTFEMTRLIGSRIQHILGHSQTNKWAIDQVMDIDAPETYDIFLKSVVKLRRSSGY